MFLFKHKSTTNSKIHNIYFKKVRKLCVQQMLSNQNRNATKMKMK